MRPHSHSVLPRTAATDTVSILYCHRHCESS